MLRFTHELRHLRHFCSSSKQKNKLYTKTVILPQTTLPLRLEKDKLKDRDVFLNNSDEIKTLYDWQQKHLAGPAFVLHDGPPYANGAPHLGHAINKILKDIIVRIQILEGRQVHYVPGWDCHGLPIELKAVTNAKETLSPMQIRHKARNFAKTTIEKQREVFESWGIVGDWKNPYTTYSNSYIKNQIRQFYNLYKKELVFRDVKPVYWSPSSRTALAEAELEYNNEHKSTAVTVRLKMVDTPDVLRQYSARLYALIWTTTPWTLPSNQAVCFNPALSYSLVQNSENEFYIVATDLVASLSKNLGILKEIQHFPGPILSETTYIHPIYKSVTCPFLPSMHATGTKGTGLVHTAPAHGPDDFLVALNNKIPVKCFVNEEGCYMAETGDHLRGLFVLNEGNSKVLDIVKSDILHEETFVHSYPYDWRTKQPVILRASEQWFLNTDKIKHRCVELLEDVQIIPKANSEKHRKNLVGQITKRPYWCISRQRTWGVPIPVLYEKSTGNTILSQKIIDNFCELLDEYGPDFWWSLPKEKLITEELLKDFDLHVDEVEKRRDILDIWFDSGLSWSSVLKDDQVADVYLEGFDQCTGWFQSSLLTSVALRDTAPYRNLYVHGFVVDENGLKMSKSLGNVIDPQDIVKGAKGRKPYGVDTLRWWVACHANQDSMTHIGDNVLASSADDVQKIRSTLRFTLGALKDYKKPIINQENLLLIDRYMLHLLWNYNKQTENFWRDYQFNRICVTLINLLTNPVSAVYYTSIKDRLYCDRINSESRRSVQFVLYELFHVVSKSVGPIIPHLVEEMYMHLPQRNEGSFFKNVQNYAFGNWENKQVETLVEIVLNIKKDVNKEVGANTIGANVQIQLSEAFAHAFKAYNEDLKVIEDELCDILQVSQVNLVPKSDLSEGYILNITKSPLHVCNRCRKVSSRDKDKLCDRCSLVVNDLNKEAISI